MTVIYKICSAGSWREAEEAGAFAGAPVDLADGFIHLSTAAQVAETAARHFAGQPDLVLVTLDQAALGDGLRYEVSRGGDRFPHLFGALPLSAVRDVRPIPSGPDGGFLLPPPAGAAEGVFDPPSHGWTTREATGLIGLVGPVWERPEADGPAFGFLAEARHLNRGGIVHGGMLMAFADEALGRLSVRSTSERRQATIQLDTHFVSAVRDGEFVEARCRIVRQTRSVNFLAGTLTVSGRVVVTANGIWKLTGARS